MLFYKRRSYGIVSACMRALALLLMLCLFLDHNLYAQSSVRQDISLNEDWLTTATSNDEVLPVDHFKKELDTKNWKRIDVPHNWDGYEGYRRMLHGNRHGDAWYRKTIKIRKSKTGKRFFLYFEGVGSYATVYLNDQRVGEHAGGRTTFTIDVTDFIRTDGSANLLAVRSWHPSNIKDLPWVCGGCSDERGFSEGSQPMGIFRPVHLLITNETRVVPFGVHAWAKVEKNAAMLNLSATLKNYSTALKNYQLVFAVKDAKGKVVYNDQKAITLKAGDSLVFKNDPAKISQPVLWSVENPYLYNIVTTVKEGNSIIDELVTPFGFRTVNWRNPTNQFILNGKPVFINGVAEYEHLIGQSHAFSKEQIIARMKWLQYAGFNAFRDGHQPHNLLYGQLCDEKGILWWTQLSAHVWYDSPEFRSNFKKLLTEWVIERRNNPSVILWGLQNESKLPEDFARECTELIRQLDPTASTERLVTTCNGGAGTDWDVPQNWTGTYGGDPNTYGEDVKKQVLIGEYGAWRTLGLHTEGPFVQNGVLSEDRMTLLMEQKIRLAESVKDSSAGQFFWLLTSHDNPGRVQGGEGYRELDRIGPVNYKGLLTPWEEPTDAFYMFRSNYAPKETQPMVYIVSHTWPGRWTKPGVKDSLIVYSNCDEVELFNDLGKYSLGKRTRKGIGTHFEWRNVDIKYNVLYAIGYVNGRAVARDTITLHHLPYAERIEDRMYNSDIFKPAPKYHYLYRINCGGPAYPERHGSYWSADTYLPDTVKDSMFGSRSWSNEFENIPPFFASQRTTTAAVTGDWILMQSFRYGRDKLSYHFPVPDGEYLVELYFIEPWLGIGGGMDATGMRLFDVAINGKTVLKDLDIWKEAGTNKPLKKIIKAKIQGGKLIVSFPNCKVGQAIISGIAIASLKPDLEIAPSYNLTSNTVGAAGWRDWVDEGYETAFGSKPGIAELPSGLFGSSQLIYKKDKPGPVSFDLADTADVFAAISDSVKYDWMNGYENTGKYLRLSDGKNYPVWRKRFPAGRAQVNTEKYPLIFVKPAVDMQPAYDLKPVTAYKTNLAKLTGNVAKEQFEKREVAMVKAEDNAIVEWPVLTGVADIYSITLKYYWPGEKPVNATLELIGPGNSRMMTQSVTLTFTRQGKWNQVTVNTGSQINAGNYIVRLITEKAKGLAISGIDVQ
ncbi:DUF4982 domain-containing protein [Terrimonas sp. NA20]|uniref:DUF4982 domain-containing protein n=1 Tax=Terrimonas ginsenosidimutans TaxID=2908004 RepID=A0ABS9KR54_9BACT|nr:malectin domain-containing carbohydrate-binding protein [Terrimonas ginsenosidimutans]MCG2614817.1 DUF4982 domain-containing protein [Terrimonas ginsenosidimutans]